MKQYSESGNKEKKADKKPTIKVKCTQCGYKWDYGGLLEQTTCPNCGRKTPTGLETHVVE